MTRPAVECYPVLLAQKARRRAERLRIDAICHTNAAEWYTSEAGRLADRTGGSMGSGGRELLELARKALQASDLAGSRAAHYEAETADWEGLVDGSAWPMDRRRALWARIYNRGEGVA